MRKRQQRHDVIRDIIRDRNVKTQRDLANQLQSAGYECTQATISRDIKDLRLVKELTSGGGYRYAQSDRKVSSTVDTRLRNILKEGVVSVDVAQNIVVVRTMPGLASGACSAFDSMDIPGVVGSLAGDDTGILIMRDTASAQQLSSEIRKLLK